MSSISNQSWRSFQPVQDLLPILYSTRTIRRQRPCYLPCCRWQPCRSVSSPTPPDESPQDLKAEGVEGSKSKKRQDRPWTLQGKLEDVARRTAKPRGRVPVAKSTVTPKERTVFKKIFGDLAKGAVKPQPRPQILESKSPIDPEGILSLFSHASAGAGKAVAVPDERRTTLTEEDQKHIQKYPELLRSIAARATLLAKTQSASNLASEDSRGETAAEQSRGRDAASTEADFMAQRTDFEISARSTQAINSLCAEYMQDTSRLLIDAAKISDLDLWETVERNFLNLPMLLDADKNAAPAVKNLEQDPSSSSEPSDSTEAQSNPLANLPSNLHLPTISTLYPALLLLTLRIFTTHYPLSTYPTGLLPRLRELGLKPYVLGTSTQLFNSLLSHRWDVYSDLNGMAMLLQEMENGGLPFDTETLAILERVRADYKMDMQGHEDSQSDAAAVGLVQQAKKKSPKKTKNMTKEERKASGVPIASIARGPGVHRAWLWWNHVERTGLLDRVIKVWRGKVMEKVRLGLGLGYGQGRAQQQLHGGGIVEREYAESVSRAREGTDGVEDGGGAGEREAGVIGL